MLKLSKKVIPLFYAVISCLFLAACTTPSTTEAIPEPTLPIEAEEVWDLFIFNLERLNSFEYETEATTFRGYQSVGEFNPPMTNSMNGYGYEDRIIALLSAGQGSMFNNIVFMLNGLIFETQIAGGNRDPWKLISDPSVPTDLGQPFWLREFIQNGAQSEFLNQEEDGTVFLFRVTISAEIMVPWLSEQFETVVEAVSAVDDPLIPDNFREIYQDIYDLLATDQVVFVQVSKNGELLRTDSTLKQLIDGNTYDWVRYETVYSQLNDDEIFVANPQE